jgi:hypothetical protein
VHVDLHQRRISNAFEGVHLSGLDDEDVSRSRLEFFAIHRVQSAAFSNELNFVVRMSVRAGPASGECVEKENGDTDSAVVSADEVVRAPYQWEIPLANSIHRYDAPIAL